MQKPKLLIKNQQQKKEQIQRLVGEDLFIFTDDVNTAKCSKSVAKITECRDNTLVRLNLKQNYAINDSSSKYFKELLPLEIIDRCVFANSFKLSEVTIPKEISEICDYAFSGCISIGKIKIGKNVKSIGIYAFAYCNSASYVILGKQVESIGNNAFNGCQSLSAVYYAGIPANFKNIVM